MGDELFDLDIKFKEGNSNSNVREWGTITLTFFCTAECHTLSLNVTQCRCA